MAIAGQAGEARPEHGQNGRRQASSGCDRDQSADRTLHLPGLPGAATLLGLRRSRRAPVAPRRIHDVRRLRGSHAVHPLPAGAFAALREPADACCARAGAGRSGGSVVSAGGPRPRGPSADRAGTAGPPRRAHETPRSTRQRPAGPEAGTCLGRGSDVQHGEAAPCPEQPHRAVRGCCDTSGTRSGPASGTIGISTARPGTDGAPRTPSLTWRRWRGIPTCCSATVIGTRCCSYTKRRDASGRRGGPARPSVQRGNMAPTVLTGTLGECGRTAHRRQLLKSAPSS